MHDARMAWTSTAIVQKHRQWTVTVESSAGESMELAYASEAHARYIAAVLELKPAILPKLAIVRSLSQLPAATPAEISGAPRRRR
jgi:hypothetical protein